MPRTWAKFKADFNEAFRARLAEFRGNDNLTPDHSGGEGRIFRSPLDPLRALKRWFESRLGDMDESIRKLVDLRSQVEGNPTLAAEVEVVRIQERGPDWILRDFNPNSIELRAALGDSRAVTARANAIAEIERLRGLGQASAELLDLLGKLRRNPPSANLHWDPATGRIIVIDMQ